MENNAKANADRQKELSQAAADEQQAVATAENEAERQVALAQASKDAATAVAAIDGVLTAAGMDFYRAEPELPEPAVFDVDALLEFSAYDFSVAGSDPILIAFYDGDSHPFPVSHISPGGADGPYKFSVDLLDEALLRPEWQRSDDPVGSITNTPPLQTGLDQNGGIYNGGIDGLTWHGLKTLGRAVEEAVVDEYLDTTLIGWWTSAWTSVRTGMGEIMTILAGASAQLLEGFMEPVAPDADAEPETSTETAPKHGMSAIDGLAEAVEMGDIQQIHFAFGIWVHAMQAELKPEKWLVAFDDRVEALIKHGMKFPDGFIEMYRDTLAQQQADAISAQELRTAVPGDIGTEKLRSVLQKMRPLSFVSKKSANPGYLGIGSMGREIEVSYESHSRTAREQILENLGAFREDIAGHVYSALGHAKVEIRVPGSEDGTETVTLTDKERKNIGYLVADEYIKAVYEFLSTHPGALPENAWRFRDSKYLGRETTDEQRMRDPVCEDWATGINDAVGNKMSSMPVQISGHRIAMNQIFEILWAQRWGNWEVRSAGKFTPGQHNFNVLRPQGYSPKSPFTSDPVILIFDPWITLLPKVYSPKEYKQATGYEVDAIGGGAPACEDQRKEATEKHREREEMR